MSSETETTNDSYELTPELEKILEDGVGSVYGDFKPEDFQDTSDDAIDYVDEDDIEDIVDDVTSEVTESDSVSKDDKSESKPSDDPLVKALSSRGVTEEHIQRARDLGLSDDEIKKAGSVKALTAIESVLTRQLHAAGKASKEAADATKAAAEAEKTATKTEAAADKAAKGEEAEPIKVKSGSFHRFDLDKMDKDDYEEESWKAFEAHNQVVDEIEALREEIAQLKQGVPKTNPQDEAKAYVDAFDSLADEIMPEVFGKRFDGGKDSPLAEQFIQRRVKLSETFHELADGYRNSKRELPPPDRLLKQAAMIAFGDEMDKAQSKTSQSDKLERIKKQAARRRPAGSSAGATRQRHLEPGSPEALASDPDIQRLYARASE